MDTPNINTQVSYEAKDEETPFTEEDLLQALEANLSLLMQLKSALEVSSSLISLAPQPIQPSARRKLQPKKERISRFVINIKQLARIHKRRQRRLEVLRQIIAQRAGIRDAEKTSKETSDQRTLSHGTV